MATAMHQPDPFAPIIIKPVPRISATFSIPNPRSSPKSNFRSSPGSNPGSNLKSSPDIIPLLSQSFDGDTSPLLLQSNSSPVINRGSVSPTVVPRCIVPAPALASSSLPRSTPAMPRPKPAKIKDSGGGFSGPLTKFWDDSNTEIHLIDSRNYVSYSPGAASSVVSEQIPTKITGTYQHDYNILYVDDLIRKKLRQDQTVYINTLQFRLRPLRQSIQMPQTYVNRQTALNQIKELETEIAAIESGQYLNEYETQATSIIAAYRKCRGTVKTIIFDLDSESDYQEMDADLRYRISLIEQYLDIAAKYIDIDIVRIDNKPQDRCNGCGISMAEVATNENGTRRCPECLTEHDVLIMAKLAKDGSRINTSSSTDDESIENFMRAFIRKQGLQNDHPDESLYDELDAYFIRHDLPTGEMVRQMPLTSRKRRGDTNHKMLYEALSQIRRTDYYEDADLIGKIYWGWQLDNHMHLQDRIRNKYNKTQKVFHQIPIEERDRSSSLGTQYRLWRHLQLEGIECYMDEFRIAENPESLRTHNKLWRMMCEGANDPEIYYIP